MPRLIKASEIVLKGTTAQVKQGLRDLLGTGTAEVQANRIELVYVDEKPRDEAQRV
jgi:hypothetical protein